MYNSRTKSTLCPATLPEEPQDFPTTQQLCSEKKKCRVLFPCAYGRFIHFSHYVQGTVFVPQTDSFHFIRSFHFTHLSTPQHKWFRLSMPQINPCHSIMLYGRFFHPQAKPLPLRSRVSPIHPQ